MAHCRLTTIPIVSGILLMLFSLNLTAILAQSRNIGVCNGRVADNLPPEADVVAFYKTNGITKMRIYDANQFTLQALKGTNIQLVLDVPNGDIPSLASDATAWVQTNILSYYPAVQFRYIAVGNEIGPNDPVAPSVLQAITNINTILAANNASSVKATTSINLDLLGTSYPPSAGAFADSASPFIVPIVQYLANNNAPLLANVYPYFAYVGNPGQVDLKYSIFGSLGKTVVQDGPYGYSNLFHAMLDSIYAALEKVAAPNVQVVVSETGWPSAGGDGATIDNASAYYLGVTNAVVTSGTPKKPGQPIETYLFAMFDENQKPGAPSEKHFGLFTPGKQAKYPVKFT
ncbi:Glucan endo-1,3-beta-glucosidase, acidic isoform GL153 [Linum grandiflorum]